MKNAKVYIVTDWTGKNVAPSRVWDTFENAWEFVRSTHPDESDWQEFEVVAVDLDDHDTRSFRL